MNNPLVSVIVPAYNAAASIKQCIESIENQVGVSFEAIVINDGSSDATASILEELARSRPWLIVINRKNSGVSAARNAGMKAASGRFLTFLDADDMLAPGALHALVSAITTANTNLVYGAYEAFGKHISPRRIAEFSEEWNTSVHSGRDVLPLLLSLADDTPSGAAWRILFEKDYLQKLGVKFPEGIRMSEDYCFMLWVLASDPLVSVTDKVVYRYRMHSESATSKYMPSMRNDMDYVNSQIFEICKDIPYLMEFYQDCVANTCLTVAQNELMNPMRKGRTRRCKQIFNLDEYRRAVRQISGRSTLTSAKTLVLKVAYRSPLLGTLFLEAFQAMKSVSR